MRRFLIVAAIAAIALVPARGSSQEPGSAGGTIGKQGRSASGSEATEPQRASPRTPGGATAAKPPASGGSSCGKLVGTWQGPTATSVFNSNGTVTSPSFPYSGPWTCRNGQLVITWKDFGADQCQMSANGDQMNCTNAFGISFTRTRISGK
jgi:hypothetical protein